jgi:hypothetical protein
MATFPTLSSIIDAIPQVSNSPLALVAYLSVVGAWILLGWRIKRNRNLLGHLDKLPEKDRIEALRMEMGEQSLRTALSPEQWLRSRIHKFLFYGFTILCVAVVVIFALAGIEAKGQVGTSISLYRDKDESTLQPHDTSITYRYDADETGLHVMPVFPYLQRLRAGDEVAGIRFASWYEPFSWALPRLSIKISNNSKKTLYITEVVADVLKNKVEWDPLLFVRHFNEGGQFAIYNDGWGSVKKPVLDLSFAPAESCDTERTAPKEVRVPVNSFAEGEIISISELVSSSLRKQLLECTDNIEGRCIGNKCTSGGSIEHLKCQDSETSEICRNVSGKLDEQDIAKDIVDMNRYVENGSEKYARGDVYFIRECRHLPACVRGTLSYDSLNTSKRNEFRFKTFVSLGEPGVGAPAPPSYFYNLFIKAGQEGTSVRLPVSHVIKPGETDHVVLTIASDKSTAMKLVFRVLDAEKKELARENISINLILPRSGSRFIEAKASTN